MKLSDIANRLIRPLHAFSSNKYWESRYRSGGNSGAGSYRHLAEFKAEVLNNFVAQNEVSNIVEFGCGDGNQLSLANYPTYLGVDVSDTAVEMCRRTFSEDSTKHFIPLTEYHGAQADLALSLDVLFHLVEDDVFDAYMRRLFAAARRFVIVYSSNTDNPHTSVGASHVRHRHFTRWVERNEPEWRLVRTIPNRYPYNGNPEQTSFADFFFFAPRKNVRSQPPIA